MEKRTFYNEYDSSKTYLWALLLPQVVSFVVAMIFSSIYKTTEEMTSSLAYLFVACILAQACFAFIVFYYNKKNKINFKVASKIQTNFSLRNLIGCMAISIIAVFGFVNLVTWLNSLFASVGFDISGVSLPINNFGWLVINIVLLAIIPAIFEECIFRGIIFNGLRGRGFWFASLISAVMFALVHLSMGQLIFPIIMGVVFAFVLEKTGSLLYTMICHLCNNFIVLLISYIGEINGRQVASIIVNCPLNAIIVIAIAFVAVVAIFLIVKFVLKPAQKKETTIVLTEQTKQDKKTQNLYIFGALLVGVVLWLIIVIYGLLV
ncbi:MAG: CPBP family intramembrane metalloprotease [Clostridiales bacterium]|nr:CPBP family intramembrane metalloprotease [Clostridiales bacterium]